MRITVTGMVRMLQLLKGTFMDMVSITVRGTVKGVVSITVKGKLMGMNYSY